MVADVFLRAMEALDRYEDRGLPFVAFLFRVARNAAIDKSRRTRPDMSIDDLTHHPESGQNVEGEAMRAMEHQALVTAMSKLKADYREVLLLRFVEERRRSAHAAASRARPTTPRARACG